MKFVWIGVSVVVACIIAFIVVGSMMPSEWHVERSIVINATPEAIFPWLNDLKKWPDWSPWNEQQDSTFKRTFGGPERGVGASMMWQGEEIGRGRIGITSSIPYERVSYDLFSNDSMTPSKGAIALIPQATGTIVTWTDDGDMGANIFGRFALDDVDEEMGSEFETGLSNLKSKVETAAPVAAVQPDAGTPPAAADSAKPPPPDTTDEPPPAGDEASDDGE